jgi:hypothetical protein
MFVNPTGAQLEKTGDLLEAQYVKMVIRFKRKSHVPVFSQNPAGQPGRNGSFGGERCRTGRRSLERIWARL